MGVGEPARAFEAVAERAVRADVDDPDEPDEDGEVGPRGDADSPSESGPTYVCNALYVAAPTRASAR